MKLKEKLIKNYLYMLILSSYYSKNKNKIKNFPNSWSTLMKPGFGFYFSFYFIYLFLNAVRGLTRAPTILLWILFYEKKEEEEDNKGKRNAIKKVLSRSIVLGLSSL